MSIVILGAKGMLGRMLTEVIGHDQEVAAFDRDAVDITDIESVRRVLREIKPGMVINAAAYTDVDGAETNNKLADLVNGEAVGNIARACIEHEATLVHYSTDYVFDGLDSRGYDEDAEPAPINAYGRSKLLGEQRLLSAVETGKLHYYLIRTSWLYGPWGKNFVDTMLRLGKRADVASNGGESPSLERRGSPENGRRSDSPGREVKVVEDQYGKPTFTYDLAFATRELLEAEEDHEAGIYHITNETPEGGISWYEFAVEIFRQAKLPVQVISCLTEEFPRPAKRPMSSVLVNTKLFARRPWEEALADHLRNYAPLEN